MKEMNINQLPGPTWNWLHVNDRKIRLPEEGKAAVCESEIPEGIRVVNPESGDSIHLSELDMSGGKELDSYVEHTDVLTTVYQVPGGAKVQDPLRLRWDYTGQKDTASVSRNVLELGADSELTVICILSGKEGVGVSDLRIRAEKGARLTLVRVYQTGEHQQLISTIGGSYGEDAGLHLIEVVTGGSDLTIGCHADLNGTRSYLDIDNGYYVEQEGMLDVNYVARHRGVDTNSRMIVNGALKDRAAKNFRGTIDFIKGCKGAKGDEREDILLMDPTVHNRTVPLILCAEEDVEGGHGASIGKLSEDIRFYFQSRGISGEEIIDLMARARIDAVAGRIPDERTRKLLLNSEE